jgi:preprotein translocase subunit YajC
MFTTVLYAMGNTGTAPVTPGTGAEQPNMLMSLLPLVVIFVLFYFMFIMPQRKEQKKLKEMLSSLKPGDKVITTGGIVGTINKILDKEEIVQIKTGENTNISVLRPYISKKIEKEEPATAVTEADKK